jgi:hypothetical protein
LIVKEWQTLLQESDVLRIVCSQSEALSLSNEEASLLPRGSGFAKNQAIRQWFVSFFFFLIVVVIDGFSSGGYFLCLMDADDEMFAPRIWKQLLCSIQRPQTIIGSQFKRLKKKKKKKKKKGLIKAVQRPFRDPEDATERYTR